MKRCISRIKEILIHLWRTIRKYACITFHYRKWKIRVGNKSLSITTVDSSVTNETDGNATVPTQHISNIEGGILYDTEPNSLLESTGDEEKQSD